MARARTVEFQAPGRTVAAELPVRVVAFLRTVGTHAPIRATLERGGYTESDHEEGLDLLARLCAWESAGVDPDADRPAHEARAAIATFVKRVLPRLHHAIARLHPEHRALFDVHPIVANDPVVVLSHWLDRVRALEGGRQGSGVLATLAQRRVDARVRQELDRLVDAAVSTPETRDEGPLRADRSEVIHALHAWYVDWSGTARALIRRQDWLISLGLSERERRGKRA